MGRVIAFSPAHLSALVTAVSSATIVTSLLLAHYIPTRFRIHPIPYLSDAGLRDPERFILCLGIQFSVLAFLPLVLAVYLTYRHHLSRLSLVSGLSLAASLTVFTTVPGWWAPHHIFASLFAGSAAVWCFCCTRMEPRNRRLKTALWSLIVVAFAGFGGTWALIKLQIPYRMIPNKDPRFVVLAIGEYVGTCAFLVFIALVGRELGRVRLELAVRLSKEELLGV